MPARGIEEITRILDEHYSAIFQSAKKNINRRYSQSDVFQDSFDVSTFNDASFVYTAFPYRAYHPLDAIGSGSRFTDGYTPIDSNNRVALSNSYFDFSTLNIVVRLTKSSAGVQFLLHGGTSFSLGIVNETITIVVDSRRLSVAIPNGDITLCVYISSSQIALSVNGSAYTTEVGTLPNDFSVASLVSIGSDMSGNNRVVSPIHWMIISSSRQIVSDELAFLHAINNDFYLTRSELLASALAHENDLLDGASLIWPCESLDHLALAVAGEGYVRG